MRVLILTYALAITVPLLAREKTDVIVMTNGDRLTGEIRGLDSGTLFVNFDYILGTSSVEWAKVHHLESHQLFIVKTQSGAVYTGTLRTPPSENARPIEIQVIAPPEEKVALEQQQIARMTQTSENFWQRLNGKIDAGIQYSKGNQATQFNLGSTVEYPRERWGTGIAYNSTLASSTGASVATRNTLDLKGYRLLRWDNWFYAGLADFLQSSEQNINLRTNLAGGLGRFLKNTNRARIWVLGGAGWQNTQYSQAPALAGDQNIAAAVVAGQAKFFVFNKTNLTLNGFVFPALSQPGRVYVNTSASYYVKIFGDLTWNISFYGNWDNEAPPHFSGSDYGMSAGLGWKFGNR